MLGLALTIHVYNATQIMLQRQKRAYDSPKIKTNTKTRYNKKNQQNKEHIREFVTECVHTLESRYTRALDIGQQGRFRTKGS